MDIRKSLEVAAGLLFRSMDAVRGVPDRAADLRERALALPLGAAAASTAPEDDQPGYVKLLALSQHNPPAVFAQGMDLLADRAFRLAERLDLNHRKPFVPLIGDLRDDGLLDFEAYALLRDIASLASDVLHDPPDRVTRAAALDFALAVRGAHRLLARLIAAAPGQGGAQSPIDLP